MPKGIVYIDIDDEITGVIDKVESSPEKVLALVLPKHATTFLSSVNMKLLKRASDLAKKSIVLITSDDSVVPLAGLAKLHVAKSLQSKPYLPTVPDTDGDAAITLDAQDSDDSLRERYERPAVASKVPTMSDNEADSVLEFDNTIKKAPKTAPLGPKNKKLKVPNFTSFRLRLFLGGLVLVLLVVGSYFAFAVMPKAKIVLKTDTTTVEVKLAFTANTNTKELDTEKMTVPAVQVEHKELDTEKVTATGKKDVGTKATGTLTVFNCTDNPVVLPAGTVFTNSGHSFTTDSDMSVPGNDFFSDGSCKKKSSLAEMIPVTAIQAGDNANLSAGRDYVTPFATTITAVGGAMGGGTSKIVTILSNDDVESAKQKLAGRTRTQGTDAVKQQLTDAQKEPLTETFKEQPPTITLDARVGDEITTATVRAETKYTMLGVKKDDLVALIKKSVEKQITNTDQKIQDNGYTKKQLQLSDGAKPTEQKLNLSATAVIGPDIDTAGIAKEVAGKKRGEIQAMLTRRAGIKDVTVTYNPFWVLQTPSKASKITVVVEQTNAAK